MVRTRIAPSPTGSPHIGTIYQAMIDRAYATKNNGKFFIRIEDTDQKRLVEGSEDKIYEAIDWAGLTEDESPRKKGEFGPYKQSERLSLYKKYAEELLEKGHAYYCFCTAERLDEMRKKMQAEGKAPLYDKHCRDLDKKIVEENLAKKMPHVIRMKIPENKTIVVTDLLRGQISFESKLIDDQVLLKTDGFPTYHLAVVVDDRLMGTTHVVRASEWIPSLPKHQLLYEYFGWELPIFVHTPLLTNMDGSKISKRHGHSNVEWYQEQGYLPETILNFLALLGWSHPKEKEIFDFEEFTQVFDLKDLHPISPKFDLLKLDWMNGEYIRKSNDLGSRIKNYVKKYNGQDLSTETIEKTVPLVQTRMKKLSEYWPLVQFIFEQPSKIDFPLEAFKQAKKTLLEKYRSLDWQHALIYKGTEEVANTLGIKPVKLYMDIRFALSNQKVTAPLFEGMEMIGKEKAIKRLEVIE